MSFGLGAAVLLGVVVTGCPPGPSAPSRGPQPPRQRAFGAGASITHAESGVSLAMVPSGVYMLGGSAGTASTRSAIRISLNAFYLGVHEVTNEQYVRVMGRRPAAMDRPMAVGARSHPVSMVTWLEAIEFCGRTGLRLPTEDEWEAAARGQDGRRFPWGDTLPSHAQSNIHGVGLTPHGPSDVGSYTGDVSPFGMYDMGGNVSEWVSTEWSDMGSGAPGRLRVYKGGSWNTTHASPLYRNPLGEGRFGVALGFRVACDALTTDELENPR